MGAPREALREEVILSEEGRSGLRSEMEAVLKLSVRVILNVVVVRVRASE